MSGRGLGTYVTATKTDVPRLIPAVLPEASASAAVLAVSSDGRVLAANRLACSLLGRRRVELRALNMADIGISPPVLARLYDEVDDEGLTAGEASFLHKDGGAIPARYKVTRIDLLDGSLYVWVAHPWPKRPSIRRDAGRRADTATLCITDRELEIVQLIADGLGNQEIAQTLEISLETVKTHVCRLLGKLGARSRAHAVAVAWRSDLVD